jgi:phytoene dehydrogenase-like protein
VRYDACIVGAGAEGLAAAASLARRGLTVFVAERDSRCGGRCITREFHPGFRASPYADVLAPVPDSIFRALDLARRGAVFMPAVREPGLEPQRRAAIARVLADAAEPLPRRRWFAAPPPRQPWPGEELAVRPLAGLAAGPPAWPVCDPGLEGSALALLAGGDGGMVAGGLGRLGGALLAAAKDAGAEISCGLEVTDIRRRRGRVAGVCLADGTEIAARAVVSTLDVKRTFLSLFAWNELPKPVVERAAAFRPAPGTARLLVALKALPAAAGAGAPLYLSPDEAPAYRAWRSGAVPRHPPLVARLVSAVDPSLAPDGAATLTVTAGGIPHAPFDGAWTHDKRERLREEMLATVEAALPGLREAVAASVLLVPPDFENQLGITAGDLWGGELAPDQMLAFRPFADCGGTRTPVAGLYLAGPSSALGPIATCASGVAAAAALAADLAAGRLR